MIWLNRQLVNIVFLSAASAPLIFPATINMGFTSFDLTFAPNVGEVDIANETGPNSTAAPDPTFPVTNSVALSNLKLVVNFKTGPSSTYTSGYFTLAPDGLSFDGDPVFNIALDPVTSVVLTGTFDTTSLTLNDGSHVTINPTFTATITDLTGELQDGDFAVIEATTASGMSSVPEPATWFPLAGALALLLLIFKPSIRRAVSSAVALAVALAVTALAAQAYTAPPDQVKLNVDTTPSSGVAGSTQVSVTGSGFPAAPIPPANVTITFAATCGGAPLATTTALQVENIIGSDDRIEFLVPGALTTSATYYVSLSGTSEAGVAFVSSNCSAIAVTATATIFGSCNPGSSMGILASAAVKGATVPVTAYVPDGSWYFGTTGIQVVPLEGPAPLAAATSVLTPDVINSCSTNSVTGWSVCTANGSSALVYLLYGTAVKFKVASGSNSTSSFSGGACYNCGVAVNSVTNQAVVTMGYSGAASGLQFLNLAPLSLATPAAPVFGAVVPTANEVSEDVLWDPFINQILSPNENYVYDIFQISGAGTPGPANVAENAMSLSTVGEPDSAGEDCSTHIALTGGEFADDLVLIDLTQAAFTAGKPGSWTAPTTYYQLPEFANLSAGPCPVAVAPGSTHLGVVGGEFAGNYIGIISLPTTSGKAAGAPKLVDYVVAQLPNTPDGSVFQNGTDPHTVTAYTSPNNQKAYGVAASWSGVYGEGTPTYIGVIDLAAILNPALRSAPGSHYLSAAATANLLASGIVRYVKAQ